MSTASEVQKEMRFQGDEVISLQKGTEQKSDINLAIDNGERAIVSSQDPSGYWCYELEADCTIPAEYILMMHFVGEVNETLQKKMVTYIRKRQQADGGWPLYLGGKTDISCTVKAYYALKLAGEDIKAPHMLFARRAILERGGAAKSNVFTRIALATFNQLPWRGVPFIPAEIMLLPRWFPFHISKVSYWSRTVMIPLMIIYSLRAKAKNPTGVGVSELFTVAPEKESNYFEIRSSLNRLILWVERIAYHSQWMIPGFIRRRAINKARKWFVDRLNGESGLGAIFPAMVNAYEALLVLGHDHDDPLVKTARKALDLLVVEQNDEAYCQPCVSPVWDTLLASCALISVDSNRRSKPIEKGLRWLQRKQITSGKADWKEYRPGLISGGWAFQFDNDYYPDLDDTAFAGYALVKANYNKYKHSIDIAAKWIAGMQSKNGGFGAFDADNTYYYLNEIPFADHGALLDPPTADVTGRCVMFLATLVKRYPEYTQVIERAMDYLSKEQEENGAWFGRWGTNYIYGTWSVLMAFEELHIGTEDPRVEKAVAWLKSVQRPNGGWGEDNDSYEPFGEPGLGYRTSSFQTAWAVLGLLCAGEENSESVQKGVEYLIKHQGKDGLWYDPDFTAPGFPRVFYLKYHGYDKYFPLWAIAKYRRLAKT